MTPIREKETVVLQGGRVRARADLHRYLKGRGYRSIDDYYLLERMGKVPPWQSRSIVVVDVLLDGREVYETEEDVADAAATAWNALRVSYLLASLPIEQIEVFCGELEAISASFELHVEHMGQRVDVDMVRTRFLRLAEELAGEHGTCGSEQLAIAIQSNLEK